MARNKPIFNPFTGRLDMTEAANLDDAYDNFPFGTLQKINVDEGAIVFKVGDETQEVMTPALNALLKVAFFVDLRMASGSPVEFAGGMGFVQSATSGLGNLYAGLIGATEILDVSQGVTLTAGTAKIVFDNPIIDFSLITSGFAGGDFMFVIVSNSPNPLEDKAYVVVSVSTTDNPNDTLHVVDFTFATPSWTGGIANCQLMGAAIIMNSGSGLPKLTALSGIGDGGGTVSIIDNGTGTALKIAKSGTSGPGLTIDQQNATDPAVSISSDLIDIRGTGQLWDVSNLGVGTFASVIGGVDSQLGLNDPYITGFVGYTNWGVMDLSGIGFGKYAEIQGVSNGAVGNIFAIREGLYIAAYSGDPGIALLDMNTFANGILSYDIANSRFNFNDAVKFEGSLMFSGDMTLDSGAKIFIAQNGALHFTGQNGYDTESVMVWNGGNYDLQFIDYNNLHFGFSSGDMVVGGGKLIVDGHGYNYIDLYDESGDYRMVYSGYISSGSENSGCTAHYFTVIGTELPADGFVFRFYHMADPGNVVQATYWGDLIVGSSETSTDHDTYLKIQGKDNAATFTLDNGAGELGLDVPFNVNDDLKTTGELKGCRMLLTGGRQSAITADNYAIMGVGGTLAFSATQGFVMPRAGSIVGISSNLNITAEAMQGNIEVQARINDVNKFSILINSGGAGAAVKKGYATQARGTDTFAAGDYIQMYYLLSYDTFTGTITGTNMVVEVVFDT